MFEEIQKITGKLLSSFELYKLEELKKIYTEEQIIDCYNTSEHKNINYIIKRIESTAGNEKNPSWYKKEIQSELCDYEEVVWYITEWRRFFDTRKEWLERVRKTCLDNKLTKEENLKIKKIVEEIE